MTFSLLQPRIKNAQKRINLKKCMPMDISKKNETKVQCIE